jgi:hypothetical protein
VPAKPAAGLEGASRRLLAFWSVLRGSVFQTEHLRMRARIGQALRMTQVGASSFGDRVSGGNPDPI